MSRIKHEEYQNALKQYTFSLRGCSLRNCDAIVHVDDIYDSFDLSDNDIGEVDFDVFIPHHRVKLINLSKNRITYVRNNSKGALSSVTSLTLTHNAIKELESLEFIRYLPKLIYISLIGNPVTRLPNYREPVISLNPTVRFIDFQRVTENERQRALQPNSYKSLSTAGEEHRLALLQQLEKSTDLEEIDKIEHELSALK